MMDRFKQQQVDCQPTDGCARFKQLVATLTGLSTLDQMKAVQRAEYALPYVEDINNYNKADYWATPYETLSIGSGDAEDFAILGYYAMRAAGMPAAAMRVMAVRIKSLAGIGHAILAIDTTPEPQILDHRVAPIMAASLVSKEFQPAIGVNEDGWWVYVGAAQ
jgi:predicted transglutaminase-like cysteine proteinase